MITKEIAWKAIATAESMLGNGSAMESSARICIADAITNYENLLIKLAFVRALKAISYLGGVFSAEYQQYLEYI